MIKLKRKEGDNTDNKEPLLVSNYKISETRERRNLKWDKLKKNKPYVKSKKENKKSLIKKELKKKLLVEVSHKKIKVKDKKRIKLNKKNNMEERND